MKQKVILITGATRRDGIGFAVVQACVERGHRVILAARDSPAAERVATEFGALVQVLALDLTRRQDMLSFLGRVEELTPRVDVLINNAGVLLDDQNSILDVSVDILQDTFQVNLLAPILLTQRLLPLLRKSEGARIINVSSAAGQLSDGELANWAPAYSASKAALNACTQQFAAALPSIAVNSVCPGWCRTRMGGAEAPRSPADGAETIVWLALEAPQTLTGQFLRDRKRIPW